MRHRLDRLLLLTLLVGSAPAATLGGDLATERPSLGVIAGRGFAFRAPEKDAWEVHWGEEGRLVKLTHLGTGGVLTALGERHVKTIQVFRDLAFNAPEGVTPADVATDVFLREEQTMRSEGVDAGEYKITNIEKGVLERSGKTIHFMRYNLLRPGTGRIRAVLYLWFPESFTTSRAFFGVHYSVAFGVDSVRLFGRFNPEPALQVLDTLEERPEEIP